MTDPITVLVADDHPMFRAAVVHTLTGAIDARVLEAASQSALEAALAAAPGTDLVLLDLTMPGAIGFSSLLWLRAEHPDLPVIVISSNDRPRTVRRLPFSRHVTGGHTPNCSPSAASSTIASPAAGPSAIAGRSPFRMRV